MLTSPEAQSTFFINVSEMIQGQWLRALTMYLCATEARVFSNDIFSILEKKQKTQVLQNIICLIHNHCDIMG